MICDLCTTDLIRGDMYEFRIPRFMTPLHVCNSCRDLVVHAHMLSVNEVEEHNAWMRSIGAKSLTDTGTDSTTK